MTEFCDGGALFDYVKNKGGILEEADAMKIFKEIV